MAGDIQKAAALPDSSAKSDFHNLVDNAAIRSDVITNAMVNSSADVASSKLLDFKSQTAGDILYTDGSNWTPLAKGSAGQILKMNSGATAPEWLTILPIANGGSGTTGDSIVKGWVRIDGTGTATVNDSFNVSGIVDNGTGDYTVTWDVDFANANYAVAMSIAQYTFLTSTYAVGAFTFTTRDVNNDLVDTDKIALIAIGDQ